MSRTGLHQFRKDACGGPAEGKACQITPFGLTRAYLLTVNEPEVVRLLVAQEYRRSAGATGCTESRVFW